MPPITAPVPVDLGNFISGAGDFGGADGGREGGGGGVGVGSSGGSGGGAFYAERAAVPRPGNPKPEYPSLLRSAGVEGRVTARFIVDTAGRVEPGSIELETESNELFAAAVRKALERARFTAAETGGRKVRMRMWQEFAFRLTQ
jgi:TonB family protein